MAAQDEFPERPVPAVGALVFRENTVLLVQRGAEPNARRWSLPGGSLEVGETVENAAARETYEETRVQVRPVKVFEVGDFIEREGVRTRWHYVLIDVLCTYVEGEPSPGTDAASARFVSWSELGEYDVTESAFEVVQKALAGRSNRKI